MMKPWSLVAVLAVVSLSSCGLPPEKEAVVVKARSIRELPVSRKALVASLGLEKQPGERSSLGFRNGWSTEQEVWQHRSGLTIMAYGFDRVGGRPVVTRTSDKAASWIDPSAPPRMVPALPPRKSFDRFDVMDGKRVLFRSEEAGRGQ